MKIKSIFILFLFTFTFFQTKIWSQRLEESKDDTQSPATEENLQKKVSKKDSEGDDLNHFFTQIQGKIRKITLTNGLKLILLKRGFAPTVAAYIKFKAGSADETDPKQYGLAHMLEHMLFKGTRMIGTKDFSKEQKYLELIEYTVEKIDTLRRVEEKYTEALVKEKSLEIQKNNSSIATQEKSMSTAQEETQEEIENKIQKTRKELKKQYRLLAILNEESSKFILPEVYSSIYARHGEVGFNAYTTSDLTNYQIQLPNNRLEIWAHLEADRMQNAVLREFYTERDVVIEERNMRVENSPQSRLYEKFQKAIYLSHPYGHPVIGPMESIKYLNRKQALEFYTRHYAPNNTVISIVGNIDLDKTEALVRKYFGKIPYRHIPTFAPPLPPVQKKVTVSMQEGKTHLLQMAWFKPPLPNSEDIAFEVLGSALAGNSDTRLHKNLILKKKLATRVYAYNGIVGERFTNLFLIGVQPVPGADLNTIQNIILEELELIKKEGLQEYEIEKIAKRKRIELMGVLESNSGLADLLSHFEILTNDYKILFDYYEKYASIKSESIKKAAIKYLDKEKLMTARMFPKTK